MNENSNKNELIMNEHIQQLLEIYRNKEYGC